MKRGTNLLTSINIRTPDNRNKINKEVSKKKIGYISGSFFHVRFAFRCVSVMKNMTMMSLAVAVYGSSYKREIENNVPTHCFWEFAVSSFEISNKSTLETLYFYKLSYGSYW